MSGGVATAVNPVPVSSFGVEYEPGQKQNAFGDNLFVIGGSPNPNPPVAEVTGKPSRGYSNKEKYGKEKLTEKTRQQHQFEQYV